MDNKKLIIRNSTADFLIFQAQTHANSIEVMYAEDTIWCTQESIAMLFDKSRSTITEHLQNIFKEGELQKESVCRKFRHTANDGKEYNVQFYNLDAIISVGYRANSTRATQFRQWATAVLKQFAIRGYVIDKKRMENGAFLDLAEDRAKRHIPMTMEDWSKYIDRFLMMDDRKLLQDNGKVSAEEAKKYAEFEFEKYRIIQDKLFVSDFDIELEKFLKQD